ncbi:hypothetical protein Snas_5320 [Stackebrandtia nassauensis DSM 44728]|uniref:Uncharacterized protein n=1 Tax=Stackebrandtia nassauensis (strain DSM 44728 / CIP 108903 / NRRL B-16338 / NBRC 102104 / LLR-40K-21) TaxID=446470 RepID=D3PUT0_STANL|nr:hypothetical protein [Stackebrandtia nassauensis]ADD44954.1 hypothetical protein Snas_5320 [Stackebrandtia nassauensis DSM 44728]
MATFDSGRDEGDEPFAIGAVAGAGPELDVGEGAGLVGAQQSQHAGVREPDLGGVAPGQRPAQCVQVATLDGVDLVGEDLPGPRIGLAEHPAEESRHVAAPVAVGPGEVGGRFDERAHQRGHVGWPWCRFEFVQAAGAFGVDGPHGVVDDRPQQAVLGAEVVVDRGDVGGGCLGQGPRRGGLDAVLAEQPGGGRDQSVACGLGVSRRRHGGSLVVDGGRHML